MPNIQDISDELFPDIAKRRRAAQAKALAGNPAEEEAEEQDADKIQSNVKAQASPQTQDPRYWLGAHGGPSVPTRSTGGGPASSQYSGPKDPRLAETNKLLAQQRAAGETDDTGRYPGGAAASDQFQAGQDRQLQNSGAHVYATINGKQYDYTSSATNDAPYMASAQQERAPRLGTSVQEQYYDDPMSGPKTRDVQAGPGEQFLAGRINGQQDPLGGNIRSYKTVSEPGVSMIQGTPQQQQELEHENLSRENQLSQERYQNEYLNMSPQQRAQMASQQKLMSDPRAQYMAQIQQMLPHAAAVAKQAVAEHLQKNPQATPEELKQVARDASFQFAALYDLGPKLFGKGSQYGEELNFPTGQNGPQQQ